MVLTAGWLGVLLILFVLFQKPSLPMPDKAMAFPSIWDQGPVVNIIGDITSFHDKHVLGVTTPLTTEKVQQLTPLSQVASLPPKFKMVPPVETGPAPCPKKEEPEEPDEVIRNFMEEIDRNVVSHAENDQEGQYAQGYRGCPGVAVIGYPAT